MSRRRRRRQNKTSPRMDTVIIIVYFIFMIVIGFSMHRLNSVPSDYFRAGGAAPWWLCGTSALMLSFSAWSFTGAAGRIYDDGFLPMLLYAANGVAFIVCSLWFAARFRQMRVITYIEGIVRRYGEGTGRFYIWVQLIFGMVSGAVMLNGLAVFLAAAFGHPTSIIIIVIGVVITASAIVGGAWAILAMDFIQMLIIVAVSATTFMLVLLDGRIGGISGLLSQLPSRFFHPTETVPPAVLYPWIAALFFNQLVALNNMGEASSRFLTARDSKSAGRAALLTAIGILICPVMWAVPSLAATVLAPNLAQLYPGMTNPSEAAYVASARAVLPAGFMGLLVCGMFSATMSSLDMALNRAAGIVVMNVYAPWKKIQPGAPSLIRAGKVATAIFGVLVTVGGLYISQWRTLGLFDLVIRLTAIVVLPMSVPMLFGLWLRPLPRGIAIISALSGISTSLIILFFVPMQGVAALLGIERAMTAREWTDAGYAMTVFATILVSSAVLLAGYIIKRKKGGGEPEAVRFFNDIETPVTPKAGAGWAGSRIIGNCCVFYGVFITALAVAPNSRAGHIAFIACGVFILLAGWIIRRFGAQKQRDAN
jgi:Na+/proline symporter